METGTSIKIENVYSIKEEIKEEMPTIEENPLPNPLKCYCYQNTEQHVSESVRKSSPENSMYQNIQRREYGDPSSATAIQPLVNQVPTLTIRQDLQWRGNSSQTTVDYSTAGYPQMPRSKRCTVCRSSRHLSSHCPRALGNAISALVRSGKSPFHQTRYLPYEMQSHAFVHPLLAPPRDLPATALAQMCTYPTCPWKLRGYYGPTPGDGIEPCLNPHCMLKPRRN